MFFLHMPGIPKKEDKQDNKTLLSGSLQVALS
jgi:hypothetical protein